MRHRLLQNMQALVLRRETGAYPFAVFQVHGADAEGATVLRKQLELAPDRFKDFWRD
jgi:hypothetical protein